MQISPVCRDASLPFSSVSFNLLLRFLITLDTLLWSLGLRTLTPGNLSPPIVFSSSPSGSGISRSGCAALLLDWLPFFFLWFGAVQPVFAETTPPPRVSLSIIFSLGLFPSLLVFEFCTLFPFFLRRVSSFPAKERLFRHSEVRCVHFFSPPQAFEPSCLFFPWMLPIPVFSPPARHLSLNTPS